MNTDRIQVTNELAFAVDHTDNGKVLFWRIRSNPQIYTLHPQDAIALGRALIAHAQIHSFVPAAMLCPN